MYSISISTHNEGAIFKFNDNTGWFHYFSNTHYNQISPEVVASELKLFFIKFQEKFKERNLLLMFKIKFDNNDIRSASFIQAVSLDDENYFERTLEAFITVFDKNDVHEILSEKNDPLFFNSTTGLPIGNVLFAFKPMKTLVNSKYSNFIKKNENEIDETLNMSRKNPISWLHFKGYKIPCTMDLKLWENLIYLQDSKLAMVTTNSVKIIINIDDGVHLISVLKNEKPILSIKDELIKSDENDLSTFKRTLTQEKREDKMYIYEKGELVFFSEKFKTGFITTIKSKDTWSDKHNILTLDLETRVIKKTDADGNNVLSMIPIIMSIYDGKKAWTYFFTKDNWPNEMREGLKSIMRRKYDGYKVYTHNFSHFDAIFILDVLSTLGEVDIMMRDNRILELDFTYLSGKRKQKLYFKDSLLVLPNSLDKLAKTFDVKNKKLFFPHKFLDNENISLDYKGECPPFNYFENITKEEYEKYLTEYEGKKWVLFEEIKKYCENDTITLYQVLVKFKESIFTKFRVDFTKYHTIPSLALGIYRSNFMKKEIIPSINSRLYKNIKQAYFGGICELYQPEMKNVYSYDVNSLYPFAMKSFPMPTGEPLYVKGDLEAIKKYTNCKEEIPFGFFNVKVKAPNIDKPFLPLRIRTPSGLRTIYPTGTWSGLYFSEEILNAMKNGYEFEFSDGFIFKKSYIFTEYINVLYKIKQNSEKNSTWYFISKLLMNSLYGRFGLSPNVEEVVLVTAEEADTLLQEKDCKDVILLPSGKILVKYRVSEEDGVSSYNISIGVAAAISAYSRIHMSHFLIKYSEQLCYVDTDGIKITTQLDKNEIDDKILGKMKYEYFMSEFVGLGPKAYGGILEDGSEMVKLKGYSSTLPFSEFKKGLYKDHKIELTHEKWIRKLNESTILVNTLNYTLSITGNKRENIYDENGKFIYTKPICYKQS
jgi:hypothetical protein